MLDILVIPSKYQKSMEHQGCQVMPLEDALTRQFDTDAHFACYSSPVRLKNTHIRDGDVTFSCAVFDLDDPASHELGTPRSEDFTETLYEAQLLLSEKLSTDVGMYCTRGGGRLVVPYASPADEDLHKRFVKTVISILEKAGFSPDNLTDAARLFRLPSVVRDNVRESHPFDFEDMSSISLDLMTKLVATISFDDVNPTARFVLPESISSGNRNSVLTSYAGTLRRGGLGPDQIFEELKKVNSERVHPSLPETEILRIAESVGSYPPSNHMSCVSDTHIELPPGFHGSEQNIADVVVQTYLGTGNDLIYDRNRLWKYGGIRWEEISESPLYDIVRDLDGARYQTGRNADGSIKFGIVKVSDRLYTATTSIIKRNHWKEGFFEDAPLGLAFNDGFLDAKSFTLKDNSPDWRALTSVPMNWQDTVGTPTLWDATLSDIFSPDSDAARKIDLLEEFIGVGLLGASTKLQRALVLLGSGANGKSTVLDVVEKIFSWAGSKVTALAPQNMETEYNRDLLSGARLNVCSEMPESDILVGSAVKATISGDVLTARKIRESPYSFRPRALQLFAANFLPAVSDSSAGFWRRWCILDFNRTFDVDERDPFRADKIIDRELPAITKRCVEKGVLALKRRSYSEPPSSINSVKGWQTQADQIASWAHDNVTIVEDNDRDNWSTPTALYENYQSWCSTTGHRSMSKHKFGRRLKEIGISQHNFGANGGRRYGCAIKANLRLV